MVEASIVLAVFFLIVLGMIEMSQFGMTSQVATNAANAACRVAVIANHSQADVNSAGSNLMSSAGIGSSSYTLTTTPADVTTSHVGDPDHRDDQRPLREGELARFPHVPRLGERHFLGHPEQRTALRPGGSRNDESPDRDRNAGEQAPRASSWSSSPSCWCVLTSFVALAVDIGIITDGPGPAQDRGRLRGAGRSEATRQRPEDEHDDHDLSPEIAAATPRPSPSATRIPSSAGRRSSPARMSSSATRTSGPPCRIRPTRP